MKKFTFELQVTVYADTEDDARDVVRIFWDEHGAWEFVEKALLCTSVEDMDFVTILNQKVNSTG